MGSARSHATSADGSPAVIATVRRPSVAVNVGSRSRYAPSKWVDIGSGPAFIRRLDARRSVGHGAPPLPPPPPSVAGGSPAATPLEPTVEASCSLKVEREACERPAAGEEGRVPPEEELVR
eukprot:6025975-Prymnesium_polylepis.1